MHCKLWFGFLFAYLSALGVSYGQDEETVDVPVQIIKTCFVTDSVTCEYVYAESGFPGIGTCDGCTGIDCDTGHQEVYFIPDGGFVQPYAKPALSGRSSYFNVGPDDNVLCGTRRTCFLTCREDDEGQLSCALSNVALEWRVSKTEAAGRDCR